MLFIYQEREICGNDGGRPRRWLRRLLMVAVVVVLSPRADALGCEDPALAERLRGEYAVGAVRMSRITPHTLAMREDAQKRMGDTGRIATTLDWRGGLSCRNWRLSEIAEPPPSDPAVTGLVRDRATDAPDYIGQWVRLRCDGRIAATLFVMDANTMAELTSDGTAWLIWERRSPESCR